MFYVTGPDGVESGPVAIEVLRQWAIGGQLPPHAPVRRMGADPIRADLLPELSGVYRPAAQSDNTLGGLIPTGNPASLWGYYLGFGAIIPFFGIVALPFCVWQSIRGVKTAQANPAAKGMAHAIVGLVLAFFGLLIQIGAIFAVVAVIGSTAR